MDVLVATECTETRGVDTPARGKPDAPFTESPHVSEANMWLVYDDADGGRHYQPWQDLVVSGTLIDPHTGDDMEMIGWTANPAANSDDASPTTTHQWARCNECGSEVIFDAYVDYAGDMAEVFDNTICTGCGAASKYGNYTVVPGFPEDGGSGDAQSAGDVRSSR